MEKIKPIFIIGVGRSGTSMLQSMLNSHKDITFPPETHFIRKYIAHSNNYQEMKDTLLNDEDLLRLDVKLNDIYEKSQDLNTFYTTLLHEYMHKQNKNIVGDKDPKNIEYLKLIHSLFPNAIIVHIYRDPRAVIASRLKAKWSKDKPFWQHLLAYRTQINYGRKTGNMIFTKYYEIKYESLLLDPVIELQKLCTFLNIPYDPNMIEFYKNSGEVVQGKELSWKQNVFNPVMIENINKWKKELSQTQIDLIEYILSDEMDQLQYKKINKKPLVYKINKIFYMLFLIFGSMLYRQKFK